MRSVFSAVYNYFVKMKLTYLTTISAALLLAVSAGAADNNVVGDLPLHFSLTVQPVRSNSFSLLSADTSNTLPDTSGLSLAGGIVVDTALTAGKIKGGLAFMQGDASPGYSFSSWYNSSPRADLGLQPVFILPNEYLDSYTTLNSSPASHLNTAGIALHGGYELSSNLQINGAFLVARSTRLTKVDEQEVTTEKTNWQLNLGGAYKFKDNLVYSVNFGYLDGGDIFNKVNTELTPGHSYVVKHQLNMSF